jgi:hypothetical protein
VETWRPEKKRRQRDLRSGVGEEMDGALGWERSRCVYRTLEHEGNEEVELAG